MMLSESRSFSGEKNYLAFRCGARPGQEVECFTLGLFHNKYKRRKGYSVLYMIIIESYVEQKKEKTASHL